MTIDHVMKLALQLPQEERAKLAKQLNESCRDEQHLSVKDAWVKVVRKRQADYKAGLTPSYSWEDAERMILEGCDESTSSST